MEKKVNSILKTRCFPQDIFLDEKACKGFLCSICHDVYRNPVVDGISEFFLRLHSTAFALIDLRMSKHNKFIECGHTFGEECIEV